MKLLNLLTERRTKEVLEPQVVNWIKKYSKSFDPDDESKLIYRGIRGLDISYGYVQPRTLFPRRSPHAGLNYYNLLLSNLPKWKKYPKRNQSIICSSNRWGAEGYGNVYIVIPRDTTIIGIAPAPDIWDSFDLLERIGIRPLAAFNDALEQLNDSFNLGMDDDNYKSIIKGFAKIDRLREKRQDEMLEDAPFEGLGVSFDLLEDYLNHNKPFFQYVSDLLDPKRNGFEMAKYSRFDSPIYQKELWFEPDAILVHLHSINRLKQILK